MAASFLRLARALSSFASHSYRALRNPAYVCWRSWCQRRESSRSHCSWRAWRSRCHCSCRSWRSRCHRWFSRWPDHNCVRTPTVRAAAAPTDAAITGTHGLIVAVAAAVVLTLESSGSLPQWGKEAWPMLRLPLSNRAVDQPRAQFTWVTPVVRMCVPIVPLGVRRPDWWCSERCQNGHEWGAGADHRGLGAVRLPARPGPAGAGRQWPGGAHGGLLQRSARLPVGVVLAARMTRAPTTKCSPACASRRAKTPIRQALQLRRRGSE
jgi:hypothetical protein